MKLKINHDNHDEFAPICNPQSNWVLNMLSASQTKQYNAFSRISYSGQTHAQASSFDFFVDPAKDTSYSMLRAGEFVFSKSEVQKQYDHRLDAIRMTYWSRGAAAQPIRWTYPA